MNDIDSFARKVLDGGEITAEEALGLAELTPDERTALRRAAREVTEKFCSRKFDSCSIINARSGRCPENCKWCAQSAHYATSIDTYPLVDHETCMEMAERNREAGIGRFSLVASGRRMTGDTLAKVCEYYSDLRDRGGLYLCASLGLLDRDDMHALRMAGVQRYHCNLETSRSHFPTLCSTHTQEQKIETIGYARTEGMEICSGGIIGMGETMRQRIEFALELREIAPASIPINVLQPIPGTPLENMPPLTDDEIIDTVAIFRLIHPRVTLRFAGGRARISPAAQRESLHTGINGAIMGDMLTTIGAQIEQDKRMVAEEGYVF